MPLDARFQPPSLQGLDFSNPEHVREAFIQINEALADWSHDVNERSNNPNYIVLDGGRTLREVMQKDRFKPGDLLLTMSSKADALIRDGWVWCNGRNGTPDTIGAILLGAATAGDPGVEISMSSTVTTSVQSPDPHKTGIGDAPVIVLDGCGIPAFAQDVTHVHTADDHTHEVDIGSLLTDFKSVTAIILMKL